ncbi:hypothetical protein [Pedobacter sp. ASV28]|uniref:hypothetical protein n=1 Tax=Pedobacter sp. ASV28 TaxID=2795123 RepID=UPI0018EBBD49|nr:hypothetical protein [Pedobacter sp. ASV28]
MKKIFYPIALLIILSSIKSFSQENYDRTKVFIGSMVSGSPSDIFGRRDVEGSPFLYDDWNKGIIKMDNNAVYKDVELKYNVLDDVLYFLGEKDATMKFLKPVKEFVILINGKPKVFRNGFNDFGKFNKDSFYEVLADGNVLLLKKNTKRIGEKREYNSAVTVNYVIDKADYFLYLDGKMLEVKKSKDFLDSFPRKKSEMEKFASQNKINFKNEADLIKLVDYYNSK